MLAGNEIYLDTTHLIKLRDKNIVSKTKIADSSNLNMCSVLRLANERSPRMFRTIPIDAIIIEIAQEYVVVYVSLRLFRYLLDTSQLQILSKCR